MNILITGAKGFFGRNLIENLRNIKEGKDNRNYKFKIDEIYACDRASTEDELKKWCSKANFVFHLAGVNRPENIEEYKEGNVTLTKTLLNILKKCGNTCPIMFSSSVKASKYGTFKISEYGLSKLEAETLLFQYEKETGAKVYVYRFPHLAGKWSKPFYNSAVATFCYSIANALPYRVDDRSTVLEILFIDDVIKEMFLLLEGRYHHYTCRCIEQSLYYPNEENYCYCPNTYKVTLGEIVDSLEYFKNLNKSLLIPEIPVESFAYKLYAMYLSYLPPEKMCYSLEMNVDNRGIFTELFKTQKNGQVSVNITRPGIVRGQHWHNTKSEIFIVVSGRGLIRERRIGVDPDTGDKYAPIEFEVSGEEMRAVVILPGYAHSIINLEEDKDLVTIIWTNESFDMNHPDTYSEEV